jgi:hypothetical protein
METWSGFRGPCLDARRVYVKRPSRERKALTALAVRPFDPPGVCPVETAVEAGYLADWTGEVGRGRRSRLSPSGASPERGEGDGTYERERSDTRGARITGRAGARRAADRREATGRASGRSGATTREPRGRFHRPRTGVPAEQARSRGAFEVFARIACEALRAVVPSV